ncbi:DUF4158 domain-containing protein [Streptomyces netropsis]|uniref:DUF4158 domain-containing protein n=1 Tax=Streptomyces netropsis TaxID=55404 RepID=UPI0030D1D4E1
MTAQQDRCHTAGFRDVAEFLLWRGRFPKMRLELPRDAVEHVGRQVSVATSELAQYDFTSRTAKRHRSEIRDLTGWHECTGTDMVKLTSWLVDEIWHDERREEPIRAELLRHARRADRAAAGRPALRRDPFRGPSG